MVTPPQHDGSILESLVADCLQRLDDGDADALTAICAAHPEHAEQIRRRVHWVLDTFSREESSRSFGHYQVVRAIGRGGMGEVLLAQQTEPVRRLVALKVLHAALAGPSMAARFQLEGQALATFDHPGIAQVFDAGTDHAGRPYYVMELIDGQPLTEFADAHRLTIRQRIELVARVADAVHHAHQRGVIHRDLKPSNVLVRMVDGAPAPKVIDFGLAKFLHQPMLEEAFRTQGGQVLGTPAYMSPEQASPGREVVDARSDIYSLGVILHELLVGSVPLGNRRVAKLTPLEFLDLLRASDVPHPSAHLTNSEPDELRRLAAARATTTRSLHRVIHGELSWVLLKALARDPRDRYDAMSAFAADLRRYLDDEPLQAGPPTTSYRLWKIVRRHRLAVAVGAVILLGVTAATAEIVRLGWVAEENLKKFDRLADRNTVLSLIEEADHELWPARASMAAAMDDWLQRTSPYRQPEYRDALEQDLARLGAAGSTKGRDAVQRAGVAELLAAVDRLGGNGGGAGTASTVETRRAWATSLAARTVEDHAAAWEAAVARIRTRHGAELRPVIGMVPLGPDPTSGLEEFAWLTPGGRLALRGDDGRLGYDDPDFDPVFVFLPGGQVAIGTQDTNPDGPHYDPWCESGETRYQQLLLSPFFISKFEITQAQWSRVMGDNPSRHSPSPGRIPALRVDTLSHPVERVSWRDCIRFCFRTGLALPSEFQWEYAARGDGGYPAWWTGELQTTTHGKVNCNDQAYRRVFGGAEKFEDCDDGWPVHCPVGRLPANGFGLHEILGNVWEFTWRGEWNARLHSDPRRPSQAADQFLRGGSYMGWAVRTRFTSVIREHVDSRKEFFGLRPVFTPGFEDV